MARRFAKPTDSHVLESNSDSDSYGYDDDSNDDCCDSRKRKLDDISSSSNEQTDEESDSDDSVVILEVIPPKRKRTTDFDCPVCWDPFSEIIGTSRFVVKTLECSHKFCDRCIMEWRERCPPPLSCPMCRTKIEWSNIRSAHLNSNLQPNNA